MHLNAFMHNNITTATISIKETPPACTFVWFNFWQKKWLLPCSYCPIYHIDLCAEFLSHNMDTLSSKYICVRSLGDFHWGWFLPLDFLEHMVYVTLFRKPILKKLQRIHEYLPWFNSDKQTTKVLPVVFNKMKIVGFLQNRAMMKMDFHKWKHVLLAIEGTTTSRMTYFIYFNKFHATALFLYPLKTQKNRRLSDVFRGYRKGPLTWNVLKADITI